MDTKNKTHVCPSCGVRQVVPDNPLKWCCSCFENFPIALSDLRTCLFPNKTLGNFHFCQLDLTKWGGWKFRSDSLHPTRSDIDFLKAVLLKNHSLRNTPSIFTLNGLRETYLGLYNKDGLLYLITREHMWQVDYGHDNESILSYTDVLMLFEVLLDYDYTGVEEANYAYAIDNLVRQTSQKILPASWVSFKTERETQVYLIHNLVTDSYYITVSNDRFMSRDSWVYCDDEVEVTHNIKADDPRVCAEKIKRILLLNNVFGVNPAPCHVNLTDEQATYIKTIKRYKGGRFEFK